MSAEWLCYDCNNYEDQGSTLFGELPTCLVDCDWATDCPEVTECPHFVEMDFDD